MVGRGKRTKSLSQMALDDENFVKLYNEVGLPFKNIHKHKTGGRGDSRRYDTSSHENLGMGRQYSKYLMGKGLVYKIKNKLI
jgi:hypothetical protein